MKVAFSIVIILFSLKTNLYSQPEKIKAKIVERTAEQETAELEESGTWFKNQISLDPAWLTRGNIVLGYERLLTDFVTFRLHAGVSLKDNLDGILFPGVIDEGLKVQQVNPQISYGAELRYYGEEAASFASFFTGIGYFKRNYSYDGYFTNGFFKFLDETYKTSSSDLYLRYGAYLKLTENKSFKTSIEFGLCAGMSLINYYTYEKIPQNSFQQQNPIYRSVETRVIKYLIQPNVAINFGF